MSKAALTRGLERFLAERWSEPVTISGMRQMLGGAARTTWSCTATVGNRQHGLVFRLSAEDGDADLHLSDGRTEYMVMKAAYEAGIPVAEPLFFEEDDAWLGAGFAIMAEVPDCETAIVGFSPAARETLAEDLWSLLGRIAQLDPDAMDLDGVLAPATRENAARRQLDEWTTVFRDSCLHPDPVGEAALRWMNANMPPPAQTLALVHGDYRVGNMLFGRNGRVMAVLDWEMAHRGDPLEDLAWSLDPRQAVDTAELAGGLASYEHAISLWQAASGLDVDPAAFRWWQVFVAFRALAIWTKSASIYETRNPKRPQLARIGAVLLERQQRVLADYLSPHSAHRLFEYRP